MRGHKVNHHDLLQLLEAVDDRLELASVIMNLAVVIHSVDREDDLGLNLDKPLQNTSDSKIGGGRAPNSTNAQGCQHNDDSLNAVADITCIQGMGG